MSAKRSSSMVAKCCTQSRFSFSTRMNRSAQPLPSARGRRPVELFDAEEADLSLEVVADILAAMIVAELKAGGGAFGEGAETLAHRLPDRLQSLEAISAAAGMDADASTEQ